MSGRKAGPVVSDSRVSMFKKKRKFIIAGAVIFLAIAYLGFTGYQNAKAFDYKVSEFLLQGEPIRSQTIRVSGLVTPGSVEQTASDMTLRFTVSEGGQTLPVVYRGDVPDTFKPGGEIVIVGKLNAASGVFEAKTLMPKCPTRYVPLSKASPTKDISSWQT
ncbi:MAG: cytochrome c maturation protein CcmE [Chloroflexi bacterium]|nr:cytochrome c maturation protein CcmE [Chloroflexota bacterium]